MDAIARETPTYTKLDRLVSRVDSALSRPPLWTCAIAILAVYQLALIWLHQPWADEYQALLIATEASSQSELLAWLRYEGHPPAWYWLLRGLAQILPFAWVLPAAATLCAIIVQAVILFASPFSRVERVLLATSQYIVFEFLTISRSASLGAAVVLLALVLWRSRWFWLVMAALPMVDFLFGVISGVFLILKWREHDLWWPGIFVWLAGSAFAGWSVIPAPDMVSAFDAMRGSEGIELLAESTYSWFLRVSSLLIPFQGGIAPQWNTPVTPIAGFAWLGMVWLCWRFTTGFFWHRLLIFGFFGFTFVFTLAVYPIGLRHIMLGCLLLFGLIWLQRCEGENSATQSSVAWPIWLCILALTGLATSAISTVKGFDSGQRAVDEIERLGLSKKRWVALPEWRLPGITGRSAIAFQRLGENCTLRFVRWDHAYSALESSETFAAALEADIAANGRGYLLSDMEFNGFDPDLIAPLATIERDYNGIDYRFYVIGRKAMEKKRYFPSCAAVGSTDTARIP